MGSPHFKFIKSHYQQLNNGNKNCIRSINYQSLKRLHQKTNIWHNFQLEMHFSQFFFVVCTVLLWYGRCSRRKIIYFFRTGCGNIQPSLKVGPKLGRRTRPQYSDTLVLPNYDQMLLL